MTTDDLQELYNFYLNAYADVTPTERERLLRQSVSDDIQSVNPDGESFGFVDLMRHIEQFQMERPGAYFKSNSFLTHHSQVLSEWTMHDKGGSSVATAHTYGRFDAQGRITYLIGFF